MKKKISLLLCILMTSLSFVGCSGSKEEGSSYNADTLNQYAEAVINTFEQSEPEYLTQFKSTSDYELNYLLMSSGFPMTGDVFTSMIDAWIAAEEECGQYVSHGEYTVKESNSGIELSTQAQFEEREATILFVFDEDSRMESMDVSAKYEFGEIATKAALNTLLGMGTVFAVLIFLAFLISLMKYIPAIMDKFTKKEEVKNETVQTVSVEENQAVEEADDLELVAVIAAAIAAETGTSTDDFVVRSIRRRTSNKWK